MNNASKISLEEMKEIEVEILKKIDEVCRNNKLTYSLMDGSLIGAIRHKGFIPWDDDIDIMMPRPHYEKLKDILIKEPIEGLKYMSSETQEDFYYPFAKIVSTKTTMKEYKSLEINDYGVFIDVFPIDGIYENKIKRFIQMRLIKILRPFLEISFHEKIDTNSNIKFIIKSLINIFAKMIGYKKIVSFINKISKKCNYNQSTYVTILYSTISTKAKKYYKRDVFENVSYRKFEKEEFAVIKEFDRYLTDLFGDYMELPPIEKRISNHKFDRLNWK